MLQDIQQKQGLIEFRFKFLIAKDIFFCIKSDMFKQVVGTIRQLKVISINEIDCIFAYFHFGLLFIDIFTHICNIQRKKFQSIMSITIDFIKPPPWLNQLIYHSVVKDCRQSVKSFNYVSQFTVETYCFADGRGLFKQPQSVI